MKLQSFRIKNFKSIIDSGVCHLQAPDNIMVIAGQNESGKSAILEGLHSFNDQTLEDRYISQTSEEILYPEIYCTFKICDTEIPTILSTVDEDKEMDQITKDSVKRILNIGEFTIARVYNDHKESYVTFTDDTRKFLIAEATNEAGDIKEDSIIESVDYAADAIYEWTPTIIYFDDIVGQLPEKMTIADIISKAENVPGKQAVKNLGKVLQIDFMKFGKLPDARRITFEDSLSSQFTADFNEVWKQQVIKDNKVTIRIRYEQGGQDRLPYLSFYILSDGVTPLTPNQRSRGFIWFLSFYLELKARNTTTPDLIILFDEPGLFLHAKAQKDILSLFEELASSSQIIYSTHSPYLLPSSKLHRIMLTINTKQKGTIIQKITSKFNEDSLDALQPIRDAIGLDSAQYFGCCYKRNVITEGITDFYYFNAMRKLLNVNSDFSFLPSSGAPNMHLLLELCVGWGLDWVCIFDTDKSGEKAASAISTSFALTSDQSSKQLIFTGFSGIEELLGYDALMWSSSIDTSKSIQDLIKQHGGKELVARQFMAHCESGSINTSKLTPSTVDNFMRIFKSVTDAFDIALASK